MPFFIVLLSMQQRGRGALERSSQVARRGARNSDERSKILIRVLAGRRGCGILIGMASDPEPTCGEGLAEHAALPALLGELEDALAATLEQHMKSLPGDDAAARREHEAYSGVAAKHRAAAALLRAAAAEMAGHRDLEAAPHDMSVLLSPQAIEPFARFVELEERLAELLRGAIERDRRMLAAP
jgi:BMFP domain-containing protein YqiC